MAKTTKTIRFLARGIPDEGNIFLERHTLPEQFYFEAKDEEQAYKIACKRMPYFEPENIKVSEAPDFFA